MNEEKPLGWSATFMKQGLALFLLLLYRGKDLQAGMRSMLRMVVFAVGFRKGKYLKGTGREMQGQVETTDNVQLLLRL